MPAPTSSVACPVPANNPSSGAIILFVYLMICLSQLRRRMVPPEQLRVKMWFYPVLTLLTAAAIVGS
jgi:GABA permease